MPSQQDANWKKHAGCESHHLLQLGVPAGGGTRLVFRGESLLEKQLERAGWAAGSHLCHRHPGLDGVRQRHEDPGHAAGFEAAEDSASLEVSRGGAVLGMCQRGSTASPVSSTCVREGVGETGAVLLAALCPACCCSTAHQCLQVLQSSEELWALTGFWDQPQEQQQTAWCLFCSL